MPSGTGARLLPPECRGFVRPQFTVDRRMEAVVGLDIFVDVGTISVTVRSLAMSSNLVFCISEQSLVKVTDT